MPHAISVSDLWRMTPEEQRRALLSLFEESRFQRGAALAVVDARLRMFEERYEIPSSLLSEALRSGRYPETAEVAEWLMWIGLRSRLAGQT